MYCVQNGTDEQADLPFWADQICSFSREHITKLLPNAMVGAALHCLPEAGKGHIVNTVNC